MSACFCMGPCGTCGICRCRCKCPRPDAIGPPLVHYQPEETDSDPGLIVAQLRSLTGQRVTLAYRDFLGGRVSVEGTIVREPLPHGFLTPGGGWARYGRPGDVEAMAFAFRRRGKRKIYLRNCEMVLAPQRGWDLGGSEVGDRIALPPS